MNIQAIVAFWTRNATYGKFGANPKHVCPSECLAPDAFSGGPYVKCRGVAMPHGVVGGCGEPCSFVMHNPYSGTKQ